MQLARIVVNINYEHLNKNTVVKFEGDVKTPRKENDVK